MSKFTFSTQYNMVYKKLEKGYCSGKGGWPAGGESYAFNACRDYCNQWRECGGFTMFNIDRLFYCSAGTYCGNKPTTTGSTEYSNVYIKQGNVFIQSNMILSM